MSSERRDEQLNDALDAILGGESPQEVASRLPEDLRQMVSAAGILLRAADRSGEAPRPSFVLALEDQLRTDVRLQGTRSQRPSSRLRSPVVSRALKWFGALLVMGVLLLAVVERAGPGSPLAPVRRSIDGGRARLVSSLGSFEDRVEYQLDVAWRRLSEARRMHRAGGIGVTDDGWRDLLDEVEASYAAAVAGAAHSRDERLQGRVANEVDMAARELDRMAREADGQDRSYAGMLHASSVRLRRELDQFNDEVARVWPVSATPASDESGTLPSPTPSGAVGASATPAGPGAAQLTAEPTERHSGPTDPAPTALVRRTQTPAPSATAPPQPTRDNAVPGVRPPHTPRPVTPTSTRAPESGTREPAPNVTTTPTADSWPATSTDEPHDPTATLAAGTDLPPVAPTKPPPTSDVPPTVGPPGTSAPPRAGAPFTAEPPPTVGPSTAAAPGAGAPPATPGERGVDPTPEAKATPSGCPACGVRPSSDDTSSSLPPSCDK